MQAEGPEALSSEQWIQAARPEGPKALSPGQWIQAARPEGPKVLSPEQWKQAARPEGPKVLSLEQWKQAARPERAEALSPGQRPGLSCSQTCRPVRAKALKLLAIFKAFALTGRIADCHYTQGAALG